MEKKGTIIRNMQIKKNCFSYDSKGICNTEYCFTCPNCDYKLELEDGTIIHDFKYDNYNKKTMNVEKYIIEFFDDVDFSKIDAYLQNDESNYRLTNIDTDKVVRQTKNDKKEWVFLYDYYYIIDNGTEKFLEKESKNSRTNYDQRLKLFLTDLEYEQLINKKVEKAGKSR